MKSMGWQPDGTFLKDPARAAALAAVQWPELNLPPSASAIKGLTDEQHEAMQLWYLGVKNVVNNHNSATQSVMTQHATDIAALQSQIAALTPKKVAS
jgi:hypothetical protein